MKFLLYVLFLPLLFIQLVFAQYPTVNPDWKFIRADNTGISGDYHEVVRGDRFGNIWTGGYLPFWSHGALVRFDGTTFTNWGTYSENYLPDDRVSNIVFDNNDGIWVGTQNGLAHSPDGLNWEHFTSANSPLQYDLIRGIAVEEDDDVWVVTSEWGNSLNGGVGYFNGTDWTFYTSSNSNLPTQSLSDIAIDRDNNKWITCNYGLIKYDGLNWILYTSANSGLSPGFPQQVMIDSLDRIWICNGSNIDILDGTEWSHINSSIWPSGFLAATNMYIRGEKMIFTETTGSSSVLIYDGSNWILEQTNYFLVSSYIDQKGNFWVAGNGVVGKFDGTQWTNYTRYNTGLAENFNEDVFIDSKNRAWLSNGNGGVQVFDCPNWEAYGPWNEGLFPIPQTYTTIGTAACEAPNGDIWFTYDGTFGYAIRIPGGDYKNYSDWQIFDNSNSHPWLQEIEEAVASDSMEVFFRNYSGNVFMYRYSDESWSVFTPGSGLVMGAACMGQNHGVMYFGHYDGLDIYDKGNWSYISFSTIGVDITHVFDIKFDDDDNMWLGTQEGLWKFDGNTWTNWNTSNSNIAADHVWAVEIDDARNIVYAGAHNTAIWPYYGGMSYFNGTGNEFTTFLEGSSPIAHKQVEDLALDTLGNIWILTQSEGISIYNPDGVKGFECIDKSLQTGGFTEVSDEPGAVSDYSLNQNYPNPFNPSTTISFTLPRNSYVSLKVFNLLGEEVASLVAGEMNPGSHSVVWNAADMPSGIYMYRLQTESFTEIKKMILIK